MSISFDDLLAPKKLWSRAEILDRACEIPKKPGIYAWYFRNYPTTIPSNMCHRLKDLTLLYLGIAPSRAISNSDLRKRLRQHMGSNAYGSTLRLTLGCLLGLELRRVSENRCTFLEEGEAKLSAWLEENAFVAWQIYDEPWKIERALVSKLSLPLNLQGNEARPFYRTLSNLRKQAKNKAKELPILNG